MRGSVVVCVWAEQSRKQEQTVWGCFRGAWRQRQTRSTDTVPNYCYTDTLRCQCMSVCIYSMWPLLQVCVCVCPFFQCRVWPSHLTFPVLVLVGVLALTLPPQFLQVWLGLLQRFLLHLVLHLIPFECGLKQRKRCIKKVLVKINTFNFFGDFTLMGEFIIKKTNKNTVNLVRNKTNKYSI